MKNKSNASLSLRKLMLSALVAAPLATLPVPLQATPADTASLNALITSSTAGVTATVTNSNTVAVTSSANSSLIKWTAFGSGNFAIGSSDTVSFTLPSSSASILNMVTGGTATTITGNVTSNGNLFILNPAGITIGSGGVISANSVSLSTIPETEYTYNASSTLAYTENNQVATTQGITMSGTAKITANSGTGNVTLAGKGISLAGSIESGPLSITSNRSGAVVLAAGGALTIGHTTSKVANVTVSTDGGTITFGDGSNGSTIIYGSAVSLTTANAAISSAGTGIVTIGNTSAGATLTTNSGSAVTDFQTAGGLLGANNTVLTVAATTTVNADAKYTTAGNIAVTPSNVNGSVSVTSTAGNVTMNAGIIGGGLTISANQAILSGGQLTNTTGQNYNLSSGANKDITLNVKNDVTTGLVFTTSGNITLTGAGNIAIPTITAGKNLTVTATGNITQAGAQSVTSGNVTYTSSTGAIALSQVVTIATAGNFTANANTTLSTTAAHSIVGNTTLSAGTALTIGNTFGASARLVTTSGTTTALNSDLTIANVTITAGTGLTLNGTLTSTNVSVKGDTITQTAGKGIVASGTTTIDATTSAALDSAGSTANDFATLVLKNGPSGISLGDKNGLIIGNGTAATGNVTIIGSLNTSGSVVFGSAAADTISFTKDLTITNSANANGSVTDATNNITIAGNSTFTVAGTGLITLDGATSNGVSLNSTYGQLNLITAGTNVTVLAAGTLNLGNVTATGANLMAYGSTAVTNSGKIQAATVKVGAGTSTTPGDVALNFHTSTADNAITGTITVLTDLELLGLSSQGYYLAKSLNISNGTANGALVSIPLNIYSLGLGNAAITVSLYGGATATLGALSTTGTLTVNSTGGAVTATNAANTITGVTFNVDGNSTLTGATQFSSATTGTLTVNGSVGNATSTGTVSYTSGGALSIASYNSLSTGATTFDTWNSKGAITDANPGLFFYGDVTFRGGSINLANKGGHNFGKLTVTTTSNGNATISEAGTSNFVSVSTGSGAFTATSINGDIIDNAAAGVITTTGAVSLQAANGAVTLTNATNTMGNITLTAKNASALSVNGNIALGNVTITSGGFTATAASGKNITQRTSTALNIQGATTFTVAGAGLLTITNSGNNFGPVTVSSGTGAVSLKESATLNLAGVTMTSGAFSATSENGDVIDSGTLTIPGTATFSAVKGNVTLAQTSSNFGTVAFSSVLGNASVIDANTLVLDTSSVTGSLQVTVSAGNLSQSGAVSVGGNATFSAIGSGASITLNNTSNSLASLKFNVGSGGAIIDTNTAMTLRAGSSSTGNTQLNTSGNFTTAGGGSTFSGNLTIVAPSGSIIPLSNSLLVTGTLTVNAGGTKDLSALSIGGNLNGNTPVNQGAGSYVAPTP